MESLQEIDISTWDLIMADDGAEPAARAITSELRQLALHLQSLDRDLLLSD